MGTWRASFYRCGYPRSGRATSKVEKERSVVWAGLKLDYRKGYLVLLTLDSLNYLQPLPSLRGGERLWEKMLRLRIRRGNSAPIDGETLAKGQAGVCDLQDQRQCLVLVLVIVACARD